jgi:ABC-2 type transport system permease protein
LNIRALFINSFLKPLAFIRRDFRIASSYRLQFVMQAGGILLTTTTFAFVAKMLAGENMVALQPYGGDFFAFVIIGIALTDYLTVSTNVFAAEIRNAQVTGTLEALLLTPTSIITILLSTYIYRLLVTSLRTLLYIIAGMTLFNLQFHTENTLTILLAFVFTLLPFLGIGLLSASFIIVFKQGDPVSALISMTSGLLGGVLYPITVLPDWLQPVSWCLPVTHGLEALRQALLNGADIHAIGRQLMVLACFTLVFMTIGIYSLLNACKTAKKAGSLLYY